MSANGRWDLIRRLKVNVAVVRIGQALAVTRVNCVSVGYDKLLFS